MSLKRRNIIAWALILLAAVCWAAGQYILQIPFESPVSTTIAATDVSFISTSFVFPTSDSEAEAPAPEIPISEESNSSHREDTAAYSNRKTLGIALCFAAVGAGCIAVFLFSQKAPILGPDGLCLIAAVYFFVICALNLPWSLRGFSDLPQAVAGGFSIFIALFFLRELWGWARARFSLSWCLVRRISSGCSSPQLTLLAIVFWIILTLCGAVYSMLVFSPSSATWISVLCFAAAAIWGFIGLWMYGADLSHFRGQLDSFQRHLPITVKAGPFAAAEAQLLEIQTQHEEAIQTAVSSERFKVELIANVSHDLRTPLTSILGYSELLQKETLSPEGQEQLRRLYQKAGYMNDLVESLFELTKVSSGVMHAQKEEIDLVRLLEQTVGLFDDQLTQAGLEVRRNYSAHALPVVSDGGRMHQVFANLLGNAIKYALAGTRIYLEAKETTESYRIRLVNTASYEMDFQPEEIVQRFARGDKARSTKGSGLGLAIAQTYTESVGGQFYVTVDGDQFSAIVELPKTERNL